MKITDSIILRCLAEQDEPDSWFAICLDLNVYARAPTYEQARTRLYQEIDQYLQEAYTVDHEHFSDLVPRRAPLRFWFRYGVGSLLHGGASLFGAARRFKKTVPLIPAPG